MIKCLLSVRKDFFCCVFWLRLLRDKCVFLLNQVFILTWMNVCRAGNRDPLLSSPLKRFRSLKSCVVVFWP